MQQQKETVTEIHKWPKCRDKGTVVATPGCQLGHIWNELLSRKGEDTCDPDAEAGRPA